MTPFAFAVVFSLGFVVGVAVCLVVFVAAGGTREAPTDWACCRQALAHLYDEHRGERVERGRE